MAKTIADVERFWDENPLFTGETAYDPRHPDPFFKEHDRVYFQDVLSGIDFDRTFFKPRPDDIVLDLGCGIGFWSSLFAHAYKVADLTSADLSEKSLEICKQRVPQAKCKKENAENLSFADGAFTFVNCQGVIHHTPDTEACIAEIHRMLAAGGRASISVYYENHLLRLTGLFLPLIRAVSKRLLADKGRGRDFAAAQSKDEIVRLYDGFDNPIGKSFGKRQFLDMLHRNGFTEIQLDYFFFPFRFLKLSVPTKLRTALVKTLPFMIVANVTKK